MIKRLIILILFFFAVPVFAGQYEDALRTGEPVFLYMYTDYCKYCKEFQPIFEKLFKKHGKNYKFVKINAESPYGMLLMRDLTAGYVPYAIMADSKRQLFYSISPDCLLVFECADKQLVNFLK